MSSLGWILFFCLCCFIWGFAEGYDAWRKRAIDGKPFETKGKVYKVVELDVVERGNSDINLNR